MRSLTFYPDNDTASSTDLDISDELDDPLDTRQNVDPIIDAKLVTPLSSAGGVNNTVTDLSSNGQVANASDVPGASNQIGVVDGHTVAVGQGMSTTHYLELAVEQQGHVERPV